MSFARVTAPAVIFFALAGCGPADDKKVSQPSPHPRPAPVKAAKPAFTIPGGTGHLAAMAPLRGMTLRDRPGGKVIAHLQPTTEYGSPTVVWAAQRRGRWLGVISTAAGNNRIAWLDARRDKPRMWRSPYSLHADLSTRSLELQRGTKVMRRMTVGIGAPNTPTPTGRFILTDKLIPNRKHSFYGCCLLALSGRQPHLRPGWAGGDRIAIHGGDTSGAASAGCLHASDADLRRLMKLLPVGTPVYIRG